MSFRFVFGEFPNVGDRFLDRRDFGAGFATMMVGVRKQHDGFEVFVMVQCPLRAMAESTRAVSMSRRKLFDQPGRSIRNSSLKRLQARRMTIGEDVDRFADVVQQCCRQKFFVIMVLPPDVLEDLQAVIEGIAFRVCPGILFDPLERPQKRKIVLETVRISRPGGNLRRRYRDRFALCRWLRLAPVRLSVVRLHDHRIRRKIARANSKTKHCNSLHLRGMEVGGAGRSLQVPFDIKPDD